MFLLDHVSITVGNLDIARPFYDAIMAALGCPRVYDRPDAIGYGARSSSDAPEHSYLSVRAADQPPVADRRHWCFKASSRAQVDQFHAAALARGGSSDGAPGVRAAYHPGYYAAFVLDPHGNRLEAVCHLRV